MLECGAWVPLRSKRNGSSILPGKADKRNAIVRSLGVTVLLADRS